MPSSTISVLAFVLILSVSVTYILNTYQENVSSEGLPEPGVKHVFTPEADIPNLYKETRLVFDSHTLSCQDMYNS